MKVRTDTSRSSESSGSRWPDCLKRSTARHLVRSHIVPGNVGDFEEAPLVISDEDGDNCRG